MTANTAIKRRLEIEQILVRKYEGQLVEIFDETGMINADMLSTFPDNYRQGYIKTLGVEWIGGDEFEVILNLEGKRVIVPYEDFLVNTRII